MLAGQGPLFDSIKEKVNKYNLSDCVMFLGQRNDANRLYQAFDAFVLPSLYEGLPVVGVEAQASGLLCVFSDDMTKETKVLKSTVFKSINESAEAWANKIIELCKNYERCDTTKEITENNFNIKIEANKLEKYYMNLYENIK